ncbi:hypothetical protein CRYUN_Cryun38cG0048900 [Craigia yunnanensis]
MDSSLLAALHAFSMFFLSTFLYMTIVSCTGSQIDYSDHCTSVVSESTATSREFTISPFPASQTSYYYGGDRLSNPDSPEYSTKSKIFSLITHHVYKTNVEDLFKIEANLILRSINVKHFERGWPLSPRGTPRRFHSLGFTLEGFWSRATGKLCMVGWSSIYSKKGDLLKLAAFLRIDNVKNSSTITSLVTGTLGSLYPVNRLEYFDPISLLMFPELNYKYTKVSKESDDGCSIGTNVPENLSLSSPLSRTICSMFLRGVNLFELEYGNGCDSAKNCNPFGDGIGYLPQVMSLSKIQCSEDGQSLRFLVEFPNNSFVRFYHSFNFSTALVGEGTWNAKQKRLCIVACRIFNASSSLENSQLGDCTVKISLRFPAIWSIRNTASVFGEVWSTKTLNSSGYFERIVFRDAQNGLIINGLNDQPFQRLPYLMPLSDFRRINFVYEGNNSTSGPVNISYQLSITLLAGVKLDGLVSIFNLSSDMNLRVQISSEGVYDDETGHLCMFPPLNSKKSRSFIKGSIESKREKSDPLFFETLYLSGAAYSNGQARQSIWRIDLEIVMAVLSNTIASLVHLLPLLLNFETLFLRRPSPKTVLLRSGGWLEVNEVIVRIVTMVAFLLQFRLLQLTWIARWSDQKQKSLWLAEKRGAFVCLPQQFFLGGSRAYAGLVLDGFLFPQILFNIFQKSRENALSHFFYIGITIIHLLPHGYDLYRAHNYVQDFSWSYIYADPGADFYSTAWDFVILVLGLFSAAIIYLQQKYGGCWFLRQRFQDQEIYEMVPVACEK